MKPASAPIITVSPDGTIQRANRVFARAVGRLLEEVLGESYGALLGPPAAGSSDPIALSLADGQARAARARYAQLGRLERVLTEPVPGPRGAAAGLLVRLVPPPEDGKAGAGRTRA